MNDNTKGTQFRLPLVIAAVAAAIGATQYLPNLMAVRSGALEDFDAVNSARFALCFLLSPYGAAVVISAVLGIALNCGESGGLAFVRAMPWLAAALAAIQMAGWIAMSSGDYLGSVGTINYALGAVAAVLGIVAGHSLVLRWRKKLTADS
ncbi:MAG: hypothetical protein Q7T82_02765 [Armatimonadota bacterium]|nr:hypothetical protein [Armatimonadota bacterium]